MFVTPEELLAGKSVTYDVVIPATILHPSLDGKSTENGHEKTIRLRPLTVRDVQLIAKAAKDDEVLTSVLMIQHAMVEPSIKQNQIAEMHSGLVSYLVNCINRISGLSTSEDELAEISASPLVRTFYLLAREFHWTPEQVRDLTVGQILSYLEMMNQAKRVG